MEVLGIEHVMYMRTLLSGNSAILLAMEANRPKYVLKLEKNQQYLNITYGLLIHTCACENEQTDSVITMVLFTNGLILVNYSILMIF